MLNRTYLGNKKAGTKIYDR